MKNNKKICCLIVTFNRLDLLKKCLDNLFNNIGKIDDYIIVNNNSNDGTEDYLKTFKKMDNISIVNLKENIGGAGGFNIGMKYFINRLSDDFLWVMDDDSFPQMKSLYYLLKPFDNHNSLGYVVGNILWKDKSISLMNIPRTNENWNTFLDEGLITLNSCSFVGVIFKREVIKTVGYPIKEFFIWADDLEYTTRIRYKGFIGVMNPKAIIIHMTSKNLSTNILMESDKSRISRYKYMYRNRLFIDKKYNKKMFLKDFLKNILYLMKIVFSKTNDKGYKINQLIMGMIMGIFFNPQIEK